MIKFITTAIMSLTIATSANAEDALMSCFNPILYEMIGEPLSKHQVARNILAVDPVRFIEKVTECGVKDDPNNPFMGMLGPIAYGIMANTATELLKEPDEALTKEKLQQFFEMRKADLD